MLRLSIALMPAGNGKLRVTLSADYTAENGEVVEVHNHYGRFNVFLVYGDRLVPIVDINHIRGRNLGKRDVAEQLDQWLIRFLKGDRSEAGYNLRHYYDSWRFNSNYPYDGQVIEAMCKLMTEWGVSFTPVA